MTYQQSNDFYQTDWNQGWDGYDMDNLNHANQQNYDQQNYDQQFGSFDYDAGAQGGYNYDAPFQPAPKTGMAPAAAPVDFGNDYGFMAPPPTSTPYTGAIFQPHLQPAANMQGSLGLHGGLNGVSHHSGPACDDFEDEPPLLEELGINFDHIVQKTWSVLYLLKETDPQVVGDSDMAGPLVFCFAFMASLLLGGKVAFGYIYGLGLMACVGMYLLLNLMSVSGVGITCVVSILGYCLLPMVILSFASILVSLKGMVGMVMTGVSIGWCGLAAAKLFVSALGMSHQQLIVMYPCCLVYGVFALLTVF